MTLGELKKKVLVLIEEYNAENSSMTDDIDIEAKINDIANQRIFEISRYKKIPKYGEMEVSEGDTITLEDLEAAIGNPIYQVKLLSGVDYRECASGTVFKILEDGILEIDVFVYPERITDKTSDKFELELSSDALEVLPYGIAADILSTDVSSNYGEVFRKTYETLITRLDSRYIIPSISIEGGLDV